MSDEDNRGSKFGRDRDYSDRNRDRSRRDFSNGLAMKRSVSGRRDDESSAKRNRFDSASDTFEPQFIRKEESTTPGMLTFKKFLATQDDSLSDEEAVAKYNDYKLDYKRQECEKFFHAHKDEEWFRLKYHPEESKERTEEQEALIKKRLEIFNEFFDKGLIAKLRLDYDGAADIIRLMDAVVVKLEDGSEEDVEAVLKEAVEDESVEELEKMKEAKEKESTDKNSSETEMTTAKTEATNGDSEEKLNGAVEEANSSEEQPSKKKAQLHRTSSIFFRTIPVSVTVAEIEKICKQHPGFLRICLSDPFAESKFQRRAWVSFRRDVNIKEIFWGLKSEKVGDCDLGATVNRDLKRRVRNTNGVTAHRQVVQNDIRQAAKLVALFDHKTRLFTEETEGVVEPIGDLDAAIAKSKNPVLKGAVDYLVEETSAEEEELLGVNESEEDVKIPLEEDRNMTNFLDRLILYLRIVHSIDFYNHGEYPNEDKMPNRIGIIHVRGPRTGSQFEKNENGALTLSKKYIEKFIAGFNDNLESHLLRIKTLTEEELTKLGKKDEDKAVEDFIQVNCVKLGEEKWLCPLSGKKFKGPEFIRKHLQSKHQERLDQVRHEAVYFNNFISDPDRPHNPEPKPPAQSVPTGNTTAAEERRSFDNNDNRGFRSNWGGDRGGGGRYGGGNRSFGGGRDFNARPRYFDPSADNGRRDPRQPVTYRDLDAPDEIF
jgi:hypothetical protein